MRRFRFSVLSPLFHLRIPCLRLSNESGAIYPPRGRGSSFATLGPLGRVAEHDRAAGFRREGDHDRAHGFDKIEEGLVGACKGLVWWLKGTWPMAWRRYEMTGRSEQRQRRERLAMAIC